MNSADLHQAIFDRLKSALVDGDGVWDDADSWDDDIYWSDVITTVGANAVFYTAPQADDSGSDVPFPYVTIGPYIFSPNDTKDDNGQSVLVDIGVWHRDPSPLRWMALQTSIYDALQKFDLSVDGLNIIDCRFEDSTDIPDPDGKTGHIAMTFRVTYFDVA